VNALSGPRLQRVLDRMEADLSSELDLKTLAIESGYSRNPFLRMFREATHHTPTAIPYICVQKGLRR
jgi:AraC family transcriptional regulator